MGHIYYDKEHINNLIKDWTNQSVHVVADFDRTLTKGASEYSWAIFEHRELTGDGFTDESRLLYDFYRPIELNLELDEKARKKLLEEWWEKDLALFEKYKIKESVIKEAVCERGLLNLREGAKRFLDLCKKNEIPVIIISGGIGNVIEEVLKYNGCRHDNIYIISNYIIFENGLAVGHSQHIINFTNKNEHELPLKAKRLIKTRPHAILLGDSIDDIGMISTEQRRKALTIGFLEVEIEKRLDRFRSKFDIVCTDNYSLNPIIELMGGRILS